MREMAKEEMDSSQERLPALEEEIIKLMLVLHDPQDSKNAILETVVVQEVIEAAILPATFPYMGAGIAKPKAGNSASSANEGAAGGFKERLKRDG